MVRTTHPPTGIWTAAGGQRLVVRAAAGLTPGCLRAVGFLAVVVDPRHGSENGLDRAL